MPEMGLPKGETGIGLHSEYNYFEYLCDVSAAELLMPKDWFLQIAAGVGPGITGLLQMSKRFQTSVMATARRLTELGVWNCIVVWSEIQEQPEAAQYKPKLVLRSPGSDAMDFKFLRNHLARQAFQALGERNIVAEYLHGKDQYCHMESLHIGAAVLSVVVPSASSRDMRALPNYVNGRAPSPSQLPLLFSDSVAEC